MVEKWKEDKHEEMVECRRLKAFIMVTNTGNTDKKRKAGNYRKTTFQQSKN